MSDKFSLLHRSAAESYAAGAADSRKFMNLYRAYLRGAYDAADCNAESSQDYSFKLAVSAFAFAFVAWLAMLFFVFK